MGKFGQRNPPPPTFHFLHGGGGPMPTVLRRRSQLRQRLTLQVRKNDEQHQGDLTSSPSSFVRAFGTSSPHGGGGGPRLIQASSSNETRDSQRFVAYAGRRRDTGAACARSADGLRRAATTQATLWGEGGGALRCSASITAALVSTRTSERLPRRNCSLAPSVNLGRGFTFLWRRSG